MASTATPRTPPSSRIVLFVPDATPAFVRSTAFITAALIGATAFTVWNQSVVNEKV